MGKIRLEKGYSISLTHFVERYWAISQNKDSLHTKLQESHSGNQIFCTESLGTYNFSNRLAFLIRISIRVRVLVSETILKPVSVRGACTYSVQRMCYYIETM